MLIPFPTGVRTCAVWPSACRLSRYSPPQYGQAFRPYMYQKRNLAVSLQALEIFTPTSDILDTT